MASSAHVLLHVAEATDDVATVANWLALHVYPAVPQWWTRAPAEILAALALRFRLWLTCDPCVFELRFTLVDGKTETYYEGVHRAISREDKVHAMLSPTAAMEYTIAQCGVMVDHINSPGNGNGIVCEFARIVNRMLSMFACMIHGRPVALTFHEDCTSGLAVTFGADTVSLNTAHLVPRAQGYRVGDTKTASLLEYIILLICYTNELTRPLVAPDDDNPHGVDIVSVHNAWQFKQRLDALVAHMYTVLVVPLEMYSEIDRRITVSRTNDNTMTITNYDTGETRPVPVSATGDTLLDRFSIIAGISALLWHTRESWPGRVATHFIRRIYYVFPEIFPGMEQVQSAIYEMHDIDVEEYGGRLHAYVHLLYGHKPVYTGFRLFLHWLRDGKQYLHSSIGVPQTQDLAIAEILWHEAVHMCVPCISEQDEHGPAFHALAERQGVRLLWPAATVCSVNSMPSYPGIAYYTTARASVM
jgi:hypothetical protein